MELTGKNFIGELLSASGTNVYYAENPSTGKKIEPAFHDASPSEIEEAVNKAAQAFSVYGKMPGKRKAEFLEAVAEEILSLGSELIERAMLESGLPEPRLVGERARTVGQLKLFARLLLEGSWVDARIDRALPDRKPLPRTDLRSMQRPLGPVGVFGASNFPLAFSVAGGDTVSALAAGCPVVFKAHPSHPGTCELVAAAIRKAASAAQMPSGIFSMIHGKGFDTGQALVKHPMIRAIGFTGSFAGGKALFDEANRRSAPIPVYAEMGSVNPVFILPRMMQQQGEKIAGDLVSSVTLGAGQFCTNPGLVFLQATPRMNLFMEGLSKKMSSVSAAVMLNAGICGNYSRGIDQLSAIPGVSVAAKGTTEGEGFRGIPVLLRAPAALFIEDHRLEEEVFGPSTLTITADTRDQLLEAAEKLGGHLTATIHGTPEDLEEYATLLDILERKVGRLLINEYPTGVEVCDAIVHGGPFPATTDSRSTSIGTLAIHRFTRPVCYQNFPQSLLPNELKDENPLRIWRLVNGERVNTFS